MAERPGGLTVLAVLNFVFAGLGLIVYVIAGGLMVVISGAAVSVGAKGAAGSIILVWIALIVAIAYCILLIISGIGLLKQSKAKGQKGSLICGIIGLIGTIISIASAGSVGGMAVAGIIYPLILIILPMTVFKNDFVNP